MRTRLLVLLGIAAGLSGCMGSQTGKALNAFDSKSHWETDYSDAFHSDSFYYSGYSDEDIKKADKASQSGKDIWGNKTGGGDSGE